MSIRIDNVTVLGTGILGSQIAYQSAYSGFDVTAYDISDEVVNTARKRFEELAARYDKQRWRESSIPRALLLRFATRT